MSVDKKKKPGFGTRGRELVGPIERNATIAQRLKKMGTRWWGASELPTKKASHTKRFKRARP